MTGIFEGMCFFMENRRDHVSSGERGKKRRGVHSQAGIGTTSGLHRDAPVDPFFVTVKAKDGPVQQSVAMVEHSSLTGRYIRTCYSHRLKR